MSMYYLLNTNTVCINFIYQNVVKNDIIIFMYKTNYLKLKKIMLNVSAMSKYKKFWSKEILKIVKVFRGYFFMFYTGVIK